MLKPCYLDTTVCHSTTNFLLVFYAKPSDIGIPSQRYIMHNVINIQKKYYGNEKDIDEIFFQMKVMWKASWIR